MIHELRTYTLVPGKQGEYLKLSAEVGRQVRGDRYGKLEGFWFTEFGLLNQVVHLWAYDSLDARTRLRSELQQNEDWTRGYIPRTRPFVLAQETKVLAPVRPLAAPAGRPHVYELRSYRCHAGRVGEWLGHFTRILPVREKYSRNVGLWQTELGQLNEVVHLWAYDDLNARAAVRAAALADPEWQAFIGTALPLLAEMRSIVLMPSAHSPMQ